MALKADLAPLMNNTKWEELRLAMHSLGDRAPRWRTKDVKSGHISSWDGDWFYHFKSLGFEFIEWAELKSESPEQSVAVLAILKQIHLPVRKSDAGFMVFGHIQLGESIDFA